jgi:hypothetical protein
MRSARPVPVSAHLDTRMTPRTLSEAFGIGSQLYVEPRRPRVARALCALLAFLGAVMIGFIWYACFVIGATRG